VTNDHALKLNYKLKEKKEEATWHKGYDKCPITYSVIVIENFLSGVFMDQGPFTDIGLYMAVNLENALTSCLYLSIHGRMPSSYFALPLIFMIDIFQTLKFSSSKLIWMNGKIQAVCKLVGE
jgi:hypothetical protein